MANTVHGPFSAINVVNGSTAMNATWGNNAQTQADAALHGFNPDLIGAGFVYSGVTCTKDGTVANQLDIAAGRAYVLLSDGTVGLIVVGADNTHTTSTINTTYFLDLNPDGTWSWGTSHSAVTNHLTICSATTDASGNILAVTDARVTAATLLPNMAGQLTVNGLLIGNSTGGGAVTPELTFNSAAHLFDLWTSQSGANSQEFAFITWSGAASMIPLALGDNNPGGAATSIKHSGAIQKLAGQATAGSFGVPPIVAQAVDFHVTATTLQTVLSYTPTAVGPYRVTVAIQLNNTISGNKITAVLNWTDRTLGAGTTDSAYFLSPNGGSPLTALNGVTSIANGGVVTFTQTVMVAANQPMTVQYQDPTNTPNDFVTATIERLA